MLCICARDVCVHVCLVSAYSTSERRHQQCEHRCIKKKLLLWLYFLLMDFLIDFYMIFQFAFNWNILSEAKY